MCTEHRLTETQLFFRYIKYVTIYLHMSERPPALLLRTFGFKADTHDLSTPPLAFPCGFTVSNMATASSLAAIQSQKNNFKHPDFI